jgi:hypothetical protein
LDISIKQALELELKRLQQYLLDGAFPEESEVYIQINRKIQKLVEVLEGSDELQ